MPLPGMGLWDGNLVEMPFSKTGVGASQTNLVVPRQGASANTPDYVALADGFIVAVALDLDRASAPAGTGTLFPSLDGNPVAPSVVVSAANGKWRNVVTTPSKFGVRFRKGHKLGLMVTTDGSFSANQTVLGRLIVGYDRVCQGF